MVRYGDYSPPRIERSLNAFEAMVFAGEWREVAGSHPMGEMWRDVVAAGVSRGVSVGECCTLIPATLDGPDDKAPYMVWDEFCKRLWERVDVVPELVAA